MKAYKQERRKAGASARGDLTGLPRGCLFSEGGGGCTPSGYHNLITDHRVTYNLMRD